MITTSQHTAEAVFDTLRKLPSSERVKFFGLLGERAIQDENLSYEDVFGSLETAEFTAADAAEYIGVSIATFRRFVAKGALRASSEIGRSQLFATKDLTTFKRARREAKGA